MKNSDSTNTLEEILDLATPQKPKKQSKNSNTSAAITANKLRKSFSEEEPNLEIDDILQPLSPLPILGAVTGSPTNNSPKIKSRSRLSSAFRSLRGNKSSSRKKQQQQLTQLDNNEPASVVTSGEEQDIEISEQTGFEKYPIIIEPKKKKSKLSKKFSLSGIRKYRVTPKKPSTSTQLEEILINSSTQTSGTLQRKVTPDSVNLSLSQISLIDLPDSDGELDDDDDDTNENDKLIQKSSNNYYSEIETEKNIPVKFEKVRKIQITIQGKKIENTNINKRNLPTTITSITGEEDYLTATSTTPSPIVATTTATTATTDIQQPLDTKSTKLEASRTLVVDTPSIITVGGSANKRSSRKKNKTSKVSPYKSVKLSQQSVIEALELDPPDKLIISESILDTPPRERAPNRPLLANDKSPDIGGKGAIRKTSTTTNSSSSSTNKLKRQELHEDHLDSGNYIRARDKSSSLERGRRFPRGPRPIEDDNNTANQIQPISGNNLKNPNLSGSIAPTNSATTDYLLEHRDRVEETEETTQKPIIEFSVGSSVRPQQTSIVRQTTGEELSSLGSDKTSRSQSPVSESSAARRRIRYIDQATFYTDEEREILEGKREGVSYLSGISEYSIDSEFVAENRANMPAFGDLTMDHEEVPIMISTSGEKREHLYKILVIGELGTGKTSFIKRYVHQFFSQNYRATIGVDFALKVLHWDPNTIVRLQLWDIAGQERFGNMTRVYYKEAVGAFIVFDVTRSGTFECVNKWKIDLDSKVQLPDGSPIPCILLANKCDQEKQGIVTSTEKLDEYVKENGFAGWYETSAKENINIDEAARSLVNKILLNDKLISAADILDSEKFNLAGTSNNGQNKKSNCPC